MKIFARANRINQSIIDLLKRINITEVAIGFESGSEEVLKAINKNCTSEQNIEAAEILFRNKIDTVASYVLGLPGETDETLEKTLHQASYLRELAIKYLGHPPQEIIGNLIEINPGSYAFREILHAFPEKYRENDILGIKETQDDYFKVKYGFTTDKEIAVFRAKLARYSKKLNSLGRYTYPAGWVLEDML
ncbi:radical SAM protein [Acerihabitans sp. KWT182]|uniref:Radical SAM protein n=1 Tax=Acerihabitans sp. KWT182 TaxID=3157919 RepID=A0AAU7QA90_9GAMM